MTKTTKIAIILFVVVAAIVMVAALGKRIWGGLVVKPGKGNTGGFQDPLNPQLQDQNGNVVDSSTDVLPSTPVVVTLNIADVVDTLHTEMEKSYWCFWEDASARCRAIKAFLALNLTDRKAAFNQYQEKYGDLKRHANQLNDCHECPADNGGADLKIQLRNAIKDFG